MGATSITEKSEKEKINDDLSDKNIEQPVDPNKLAALKAKNQATINQSNIQKQQEQKMANKIISKKERSLNLGFIGLGACGNSIIQEAHKLSYDCIAINTALSDLKLIDIPDNNKLLLESKIQGTSKELELGRASITNNQNAVRQLVNDKLINSDVFMVVFSLSGGTGSGGSIPMLDLLQEFGKPIVVICVLPMTSDDQHGKSNTLQTLSQLSAYVKDKKISNLIVVDNAKIESIYSKISQMDFYGIANKQIIETLDAFNCLSMQASSVKALDSMEFTKTLIDGNGLCLYGQLTIEQYQGDTDIAESIINNLTNGLLADGFDLSQTKYASFIITANKEVWKSIPSSAINYATSMINDICKNPNAIFKGVYIVDDPENVVKVYSMFSGLGLPNSRVEQLKQETIELQNKVKTKEDNRNFNLQLDTGKSAVVNDAQKIKDKIAQKSSTFGKFIGGIGTIDKRK